MPPMAPGLPAASSSRSVLIAPVLIAPALLALVLVGPILAGLTALVLPAFGWWPALGGNDFSLAPWRAVLAAPGVLDAARLSLGVGLASAALSLALVVVVSAALHGSPVLRRLSLAWSAVPAVPHAATAIALAFLLAPSGWPVRWVSPGLTGWTEPPPWPVPQDPGGWSLVAGLVLKESAFLFLLVPPALAQADAARRLAVARTLGYRPVAAWMGAVFPALYARIRLPVLAVLVYATGSVDMAVVLGPTTPPPLPVLLLRWTAAPDLDGRFTAAAGGVLLVLVVLAGLVAWLLFERLASGLGLVLVRSGRRAWAEGPARGLAHLLAALLAATAATALASLALWSVAGPWPFPQAWPTALTAATWELQAGRALQLAQASAGIGAGAAAVALLLVVAVLEAEARRGGRWAWLDRLVFVPLLVPDLAFLMGLQVAALGAGFSGGPVAVAAVHLVFVVPYVYLALAGPWRAWDARYGQVGRTLGASPGRVLLAIRLPMLARPVAMAAAIGFAVSIAQYLSTLLVGGGRVATLTTEALALAAGGDRRVVAVFACLQALLPGVAYALAAGAGRRSTRA